MRLAVAFACALVATGGAAGDAAAYPQFQYTTGNDRCTSCHISPDGGGLLNDYGRSEAGDTISYGGDGGLFHGAWTPPEWFALGGDFRLAGGLKQIPDLDPSWLAFPMQADVYSRIAAGPISLDVTVGLNGAARGREDGANPLSYLASREHYLMYRGDVDGPYVRVGRFFPVFGVRTHDHTAYPRRHLDMYLLEEPYALGVGLTRGSWEIHATGFMGNRIPFTGAGARADGGAVYVEKQLASSAGAIAGQARVQVTPHDKRYLLGAVGKLWLEGPKILLLSELDLQVQTFTNADERRVQMVAYVQATRMFLPGMMIGAAIQRWAPDVTLRGTTRNALELDLQVFPLAHTEAHLLTRIESTGGDTTRPSLLVLLQLHYYL